MMLISDLQEDLKTAQLAKDEVKVGTLRLLLSEIHNMEIQKGEELGEQDVIQVIQREIKKRREAAEAFKSGGREEQTQKEETELAILQTYLPAQMEVEELTKIVEETITEVGVSSLQDMGKVMGAVMGKVAGRADGNVVSGMVREKLNNILRTK